jgi:hypothetical protein
VRLPGWDALRDGTVPTVVRTLHEAAARAYGEIRAAFVGDPGPAVPHTRPALLPDGDIRARLRGADLAVRQRAGARRRGAAAPWRVITNRKGIVNKVVYREDGAETPGWYCYLTKDPLARRLGGRHDRAARPVRNRRPCRHQPEPLRAAAARLIR